MTSYLPKLLITGGNGQLAQALCHHALATHFDITTCTRAGLNITETASVTNALSTLKPDLVINTAAYTAVDLAEEQQQAAMQANHLGAKYIAEACEQKHIPLIHISTDYVFDGKKQTPYLEDDATHPLNVYGESKWLGEEAVRAACEKHIILRVSGTFSEYGNNFLKTILRLARERKSLHIVSDQITAPTAALDIAGAILTIASQPAHWGTYHFCGDDPVSWYQFANEIVTAARQFETLLVDKITPIAARDYQTAATRPAYSVLNCDKIKTQFAVTQRPLQDAIQSILPQLIRET